MSCLISVHKLQQYILLQDVLSLLLRPGVRQSRQDRLKNLVNVSEHQLRFPTRRPLAFSLLSALSALPMHLSYSNVSAGKHTPFTPSVKKF